MHANHSIVLGLLAGFFLMMSHAFVAADSEPLRLYVSLAGKDTWTGRFPAPNDTKTDGPFATLERARDAIRELKQTGDLPDGGVTVIVRGGVYALAKPFELSEQDSGTEGAPIVYMAFPGEEVRLSGGKAVSGFEPVTDEAVLQRLDEPARGNVLQADLKKAGVTDCGPANEGGAEVFCNDAPMTLARWPNEGFDRIVDLVVEDGHQIHGIRGSKVGQFKYDGRRPARWVDEKDPWLHGYWFWDWSDQRQRIASIDTAHAVISLATPYHHYGYRKGQWYYAFNMLSELDTPGEWYIDREQGILYFWPPEPADAAKIVISVLPRLISLKDVSHAAFRGFILEAARGTAVEVSGGKGVELAGCVIRNTGGWAANLSGTDHRVVDCKIYLTGGGGVSLTGGDRPSLTPGSLVAENNEIHHYGRINRMYTPGLSLNGVGLRAAHNRIHSAPHMAIQFGGNEHVIEYNEIHHVCQESNDAGAIYAGRNWTMRGNVIRHNYLHHISGFENRGCVGVYLDDMFASADIVGNVFYQVTRAAFIGGGRDCTVENNIFVDCKPALHVDARALNWAAYHADEWIEEAKTKGTLSGIAFNQPPYRERYPKLVTILDENPKAPVGNVIARNICWGGTWDEIEESARPLLKFQDNLIGVDPLFADAAKQDFRLRSGSPAFQIGFKEIPIERIGLKKKSKFSEAEEAVRPLLAYSELVPVERVNLLLLLARLARGDGDYETARKYVREIVAMPGAPGYCKSLALLTAAQSEYRKKNFSEARGACQQVLALPDTPPHHHWEAEELLKSIQRSQEGLAPRDPDASRVKLPRLPEPAVTIYVARNGSDRYPGTREQPLATISRALEKAAEWNKAPGGYPQGGVKIVLRGGVYRLREGLALTAAVAGREEAPLVIAAGEGETVRLTAGAPVTGFRKVTDPAVLQRLPEESRGHVVVADLKAQGITEYGQLVYRGFGGGSRPSLELYCGGQPMIPARWPNEGFVRTGKVLDPGSLSEKRGGRFEYQGDRPARWRNAADPWLYGYWYYDWADNAIGVASIDIEARQIQTTHTSPYGMREGQPYYVFNLLEEIDCPGEWYLDREAGQLYFYPPGDLDNTEIEIPMVDEPLLRLEGVSHGILQGLIVEMGRGDGIVIEGGERNLVAGCIVRRFGSSGVVIRGGRGHGVLSCDIHTLGRGGAVIQGGDRKTLTPGGHFVENCHIHHFSRVDRTYTPAVQIEGVGHRVAHNRFHDTPCHAIRLEGNDHLIEFNEIHDVVQESDDQGGIDLFLNPSYRGNVIRYNYWHDIGNRHGLGQAGIRLDDAICGVLIYGNVFYRCSNGLFGGVQIHGGKDNWVDNNLFAECRYGISFSPWGRERWLNFLSSDSTSALLTQQVDIHQPPYSTRYPGLTRLEEGNDINWIWRNVVYRCGGFLTRDQGIQVLLGNWITREDPGFAGAADQKFALRDDAPVYSCLGFAPIPFAEIGLYEDGWRTALNDKDKP